MTPLRLPLKEHLCDPADESALARIAQELEARSPASGRRRRWVLPLGLAAAGAAVALVVVLVRVPGPLVLADGRAVTAVGADEEPRELALADGSRIRLSPGARLEPLVSSGKSFSAMVTRGRADFEVRPGGPRHWVIECGLATVEVVGTEFACERAHGRLRVVVRRGAVLVRGDRVPERARRLTAGQSLEIVDERPGLAAAAVPAPVAALAPDPATTPAAPEATAAASAPRSAGRPASAKAWRELARDGHHGAAFAALGSDGLRREAKRLGVDDLLALADVARLSGHPAEAVRPLERILAEFAGDAQAPLAAFALGRLELDALGRPQAAAAALMRALALGVPQSLREDVRARLVEAHARAGDLGAARQAAAAYADEFPGGRHARAIEGWLRAR